MTRTFSTFEGVASYKDASLAWALTLPSSKEMLSKFGIDSKYPQTFSHFLEKSYPKFYQWLIETENPSVGEFHNTALRYYKQSRGIIGIIQIANELSRSPVSPSTQALDLMDQYSKRLAESLTSELGTTTYDTHSDGRGLTEYDHATLSMINMAYCKSVFDIHRPNNSLANVIGAFLHDSGRLFNPNREQGHVDHHRIGACIVDPLGAIAVKTALLHTTIPKHILRGDDNYKKLLSKESAHSSKVQLDTKPIEEAQNYLKKADNPNEIILDAVAKRIIVDELAKIPRQEGGYNLPEKSQIETLIILQLRLHFLELVNTHDVSKASELFEEKLRQSLEMMHPNAVTEISPLASLGRDDEGGVSVSGMTNAR